MALNGSDLYPWYISSYGDMKRLVTLIHIFLRRPDYRICDLDCRFFFHSLHLGARDQVVLADFSFMPHSLTV